MIFDMGVQCTLERVRLSELAEQFARGYCLDSFEVDVRDVREHRHELGAALGLRHTTAPVHWAGPMSGEWTDFLSAARHVREIGRISARGAGT